MSADSPQAFLYKCISECALCIVLVTWLYLSVVSHPLLSDVAWFIATIFPIINFQHFGGDFPPIQEFHNYPHKVFYGWCQFLCKFCLRWLPCHFFYKRSLKLLSLLENFTLQVIKFKYIAADCLCLSTVNNAALCPKYSVNLSLKQLGKKKQSEREMGHI